MSIPDGTFDAFHNADIAVERPAEVDFAGTQEAPSDAVLTARADAQAQGRALRRLQQEHEEADVLLFCDRSVTDVRPQDEVTIDYDDRPADEGTVVEVFALDDKLLVTL